jgi:hypothetical protein
MSFTVSGSAFLSQAGSSVYEPKKYTISTANTFIDPLTSTNVIITFSSVNVPLQSFYWSISLVTSNINSYNFVGNTLSGQLNMTGTMDYSSNTLVITGNTSPLITSNQLFKVNILDNLNGSIIASTSNITFLGYAPGSSSYTTAGTYSFIPTTPSVSVVAVGGAATGGSAATWQHGGGGGGLGWRNNISVSPGTPYTVTVGAGGYRGCGPMGGYPGSCGMPGSTSSVLSTFGYGGGAGLNNPAANGGGYSGDGGGAGGSGGYYSAPCTSAYLRTGGGGAGGYSGAGGTGGISYTKPSAPYSAPATSGAGGAGAGGAAGVCGAGVGLFGQGSGGNYGGGGGRGGCLIAQAYGGAVRIVWPGQARQFPTTCVGSP